MSMNLNYNHLTTSGNITAISGFFSNLYIDGTAINTGVASLNDLNDVSLISPISSKSALIHNGTEWANALIDLQVIRKGSIPLGGYSNTQMGYYISWDTDSAVVINDHSHNIDFRVESDTHTHLLFVDADTNMVGISTSSPSYKLDVSGTFSADSININNEYTFPTTDGTADQVLVTDGSGSLSWTDLSAAGLSAVVDDTTPQLGGNLDINTHNIIGTGNINVSGNITANSGIFGSGVDINGAADFSSTIDAPNLGAGEDNSVVILDSDGKLRTDEIDSRVWGSSLVDGAGTSNYVSKWSDSNTLTSGIIYDNGTNVGIGTSSPNGKLDVIGGRTFLAANNESYSLGVRYIYTGGAVYFGAASSSVTPDAVISNAGGSELIRFATSGNVGIGTSSPLYKLDVVGTGHFDALNINGAFTFPTSDGSANQYLKTDGAGNVSWASVAGGGSTIDGSGVSNYITKWTDTNILTSGIIYDDGTSVGIGTSSPTATHKLTVEGGHVVFNDNAGDYDFRVESIGNTSMLFVDASVNAIGMGTSTPSGTLHIRQSATPSLRIHASSSAGSSATRASRGNIVFPNYNQAYEHVKLTSWGREGSFLAGMLGIDISNSAGVSSEVLTIDNQSTASTFGLRTYNIPIVTTSGNVVFNETGDNYDFRVEGDSEQNLLIVDASADRVGIGISSPTERLDIRYPESGGMALIKSTDSNDGLLFGDMAYSVSNLYQGIKHVIMTGTSDYMMMSAGTDNLVSAKTSANLFLRAGGNSIDSQIMLTAVGQAEVNVNDYGRNCDFRVEGDTDTHLLFTDASNDTVNIGTSTSAGPKLYISTALSDSYDTLLSGGGAASKKSFVRISNTDNTTSDSFAGIFLSSTRAGTAVAQSAFVAAVSTNQTSYSPSLVFVLRSNTPPAFEEKMRINYDGNVGINTQSPSYQLSVNGDIGLSNGGFYTSPTGTMVGTSGWIYQSGQVVNSQGSFGVYKGDAQNSIYLLRQTTTSNSWTTLLNNGQSGVLLASNRTFQFSVNIVGRRTDGQDNAAYKLDGFLYNDGYGCEIVGNPMKTVLGESDASWDVRAQIATSGNSNYLFIQTLGASSKTINWLAKVDMLEVGGNIAGYTEANILNIDSELLP